MSNTRQNQIAVTDRTQHADATNARGDRGTEDRLRREDDGTGLSAEDREAMLRNEFKQEALPSVPTDSEWHYCWLSTTNSYDPISKRIQLGYVPVKAAEFPHTRFGKMNSGEFAGCVSCNEMVLFKIPRHIYEQIMTLFHHTKPLEEEEALKRNLLPQGGDYGSDREGRPLGEVERGSAYDELGRQPVRRPSFQN